MHLRLMILILMTLCVLPAMAESSNEDVRISEMERQISDLKKKVKDLGGGGAILFLFGAFCALWAQNTGRSAWLWFFLGLFFHVIAVIVLLCKNANDRNRFDSDGNPRLFSEGRRLKP